MTREIKFRAWDKAQHKLMNVVEMDWEPHGTDDHGNFKREVYYVRAQNIKDFADVERYCGRAEIEELMFEQYTGLHDDVNGKEIYEGDIITWEPDPDKHRNTIWWNNAGFCAGPYNLTDAALIGEIIGNIHENPELLEETEK
ncbi:YopX family protein [Furfurilactobacillus entadae]|uniref:YopX family protein n=1 Tax=Furfurilactobacillus entadae TaxID=2922307 RepID=UPI0035E56F0D